MLEEELKQFYWLCIETKKLQEDLYELKNSNLYKSPKISDMPKTKNIEDKITKHIIKLIDLQIIIEENLINICEQRANIEKYINSIEDIEVRLIMRLRHIRGLTWEAIGEEINMSKTGVIKKYKRYIKKVSPNSPKVCHIIYNTPSKTDN